jgi:iron complex outermembrane receptor protein
VDIMKKWSLRTGHLIVSAVSLGFTFGSIQTSLAAAGRSASDNTTLEEIVVTAEKREENLQRTAVAISVRNGAELLQEGKFTTDQILEDVPSVSLSVPYGTASYSDVHVPNVTIRGIGSNGAVNGSITSVVPAVAVYVDDIVNGLGSSYDIDHVEVLRGPQGTLYGRSATSGVVNMRTTNPALNEFTGDISAEFGNYSLRHLSAGVNVPVGSVVAVRVSGNTYKRDGYYSPKGGAVDTQDGRVKLLFKPSEDFSLLLGLATQDNAQYSGQNQGTLTLDGQINYDNVVPLGTGKAKTRQYWAHLDWNLGPATLTYIPALQTWNQHAISYASPGGGALVNANQNTPYDRFHTQELRLASNGDSALKWQTGVFYYDNKLRNTYHLLVTGGPLPPGGLILQDSNTEKHTTNLGGFAEGTYGFTSTTRLTAGLRYDYTKVQTGENNCSGLAIAPLSCLTLTTDDGTRTWKNVTYKLRLEHDLNPDNLVYASVATAFLPGDVSVTNVAPDAHLAIAPYEAETLTSFEVGSKNRFLADRLQVNGAVFYYDYGAFQQAVKTGELFGTGLFTVANSPAEVLGAELELLYQPTSHDRFGLNVSYVDARYRNKPALFAAGVVETKIPGVVPLSIYPSYTRTFDLPAGQTLSIGLEGLYRSAAYDVVAVSEPDSANVRSYAKASNQFTGNINATWKLEEKLSFSAYVRNVSDKRYMTFLNASYGATVGSAVLSEPRTYGVSANIGF